jgi:hypothetical protein
VGRPSFFDEAVAGWSFRAHKSAHRASRDSAGLSVQLYEQPILYLIKEHVDLAEGKGTPVLRISAGFQREREFVAVVNS